MVKRPCSERLNAKRQNWTEQVDVKNKSGVRRGGKNCGFNCSRDDDNFTPEEEDLIIRLHAAIGSRWSIIAQQLPGRTDNDVKNCWNTKLRKKLSEIGIDPVTHKPFSQILVDYANIGGYGERARTDCIDRDSKNSFIVNSSQFSIPQEQGFSNFPTIVRPKLTNPSQENSGVRFAWSDFLLEDPFPADTKQEEKHDVVAVEEMNSNNGFQASASSSSDCSFVEAMLDRQKDMLLEFSGLLEDSFFS